MKLIFVVFVGFFVSAFAKDIIPPAMYCPICEFVVQELEVGTGDGLAHDESKIIAACDKFLNAKPGSGTLGDIICEAFVKDELENLIQALENPDNEVHDAKSVCRAAKICKDDGTKKV